MKQNNVLLKEFLKKDVNRLRNILRGNAGSSTATQVGYEKESVDHVEGDEWQENGKTWTIKDGIKQTKSRFDDIRKQVSMPIWCPECHKKMSGRYDEINYRIHQKCTDCVVKFETELRRTGKYEEYAKNFQKKNMQEFIDASRKAIEEFAQQKETAVYSELGEKGVFGGGGVKNLTEYWLNELNEFEKQVNNG